MKIIMIKKLSWAVLATILSCCVFSTQLNAQLACPTNVDACDEDALVLTFDSPTDATAFLTSFPSLFGGTFTNGLAAGNQIAYINNSFFGAGACPSVGQIMNATGCTSCPADYSIDTQPMSQDACFGDNISFSVAASGGAAPLSYQWQEDCSGNGSFTNIFGATNPTLFQSSVSSSDRCDFRVIITDADGCEIISDVATLDANSPTSITTQPMPVTTCLGEDASFTVVMRSTNVTFQWQSDCSGTFTDIAGATSATYTISPVQTTDACDYRVVVTNASGCTTISNAVGLTLSNSSPMIDTQPMSQDLCFTDDATFSATASGGTAPLSYQWQSDCSGAFTDIAGETAASLTISGISSGDRCDYRIVVTDANGCTATSDPATLDANNSPTSVTTQPMPVTACVGDDASFTIVMRSTTVTFQWQSNCSGTFMDIAGATSATYTVSAAQTTDACDYRVVVTNADGCITISDAVALTLPDIPAPTAATNNFTICEGDAIPDFEVDETTTELPPTIYQVDDGTAEQTTGNSAGSTTWGNMFAINTTDCNNGCSVLSFDAGFGIDLAPNSTVVGTTVDWTIYTDDDGNPTAGLSAPLASGTHTIINDDFAANGVPDNISAGSLDICTTIAANPFLFISLSHTDPSGGASITPVDASGNNFQSWMVGTATGTQADWAGAGGFSGNYIIRANLDNCQAPCTTNWFDASTAGNMVGTGTTFNSNGIAGEEGTTVDTNTPGTYTFYAETDCESCLSESRAPFTLTIESAEPQCIAQDITITLDGTGNATITADDIDNGSMLGCAGGTLNLSLDQTAFTCDNVITTNIVTLTVDDGIGNSSTCTATVTVLPDGTCTDPSFDCPNTQVSCTGNPFNLNPAEPGGTYGGTAAPFVMNDVLNPTGMPPSSYTLTYTINGFVSELCEFIVVRPMKSANAGSLRN